jgi:hypothetical protein
VAVALYDFYGKLNDEQKAKFEAIGPQLTNQPQAGLTNTRQTNIRRHHTGGIGNILRLLIRSI